MSQSCGFFIVSIYNLIDLFTPLTIPVKILTPLLLQSGKHIAYFVTTYHINMLIQLKASYSSGVYTVAPFS